MNKTLQAVLTAKVAEKNQEIADLRKRIRQLEIDYAELQAEFDCMKAKIEEFNTQQEPTGGPFVRI